MAVLVDERPYWEAENQDVIVIPSNTFDCNELRKLRSLHQYEERFLFHLMLLARPRTRVIFVTSVPVEPALVTYYLSLLPPAVGEAGTLLGSRLFMISTDDNRSDRCLAQKFLEKRRLVNHVRSLIQQRSRREPDVLPARLLVYRRTPYEALVAEALGIDLKGTGADVLRWGTKSGSRSIFAESGVSHPPGTYRPEKNVEKLAESIVDVLQRVSESNTRIFWGEAETSKGVALKGLVKLEDGFSGLGNGLVDLSAPFSMVMDNHRRTAGGQPAEHDRGAVAKAVLDAFCEMKFESDRESWSSFRKAVESTGAIFEVFVPGSDGQTTPSAQAYINERAPPGTDANVVVLSTHEQILHGHVYDGCEFPANEEYRSQLADCVRAVGRSLAGRGVAGHFGVDFIATPVGSEGSPRTFRIDALEINLRATGTICPLMMLELLERSHRPDPPDGFGAVGHAHYLAFDHFGKPEYTVFTPTDLQEILADLSLARLDRRGLRDLPGAHQPDARGGERESRPVDPVREIGVFLYMHAAVAELGTFGIAFAGPDRDSCQKLAREVTMILDKEAERYRAAVPRMDEVMGVHGEP